MKYLFAALLLLLSFVGLPQSYTVETVPNQKLVDNSYVSNPDGLLSAEAVSQIDRELSALEDSTTAQVAVVILRSIGDSDIFTFAEELFNYWGLGNAASDNGLLILFVEDQRTIRFHTGDGMEAVLPDAVCKQIQREHMVPYFKEGNIDQGMIEGISAAAGIIADPSRAADLTSGADTIDGEFGYLVFAIIFLAVYGFVFLFTFIYKHTDKKFADSRGRAKATYTAQSLTRKQWVVVFGVVPAAIVALYGVIGTSDAVLFCFLTLYIYFIGTLIFRLLRLKNVINGLVAHREYFRATELLKKGTVYWLLVALLFPIPFLPYFFYHLYRRRYYRNHPRTCQACNMPMKKLDEKSDDAFLTPAKVLEEKLKSVDYDVWQCTSCGATEEWLYKNSWSRYEACPKCHTNAFYTKSTRTIRAATYSSSGLGERTKVCKFCAHSAVSTYTIPMKTSSSSSSSGGGSSGGSWGGGSSSGGGASSSW